MDKADMQQLAHLCYDAGLNSHAILVAMHIAMDECDNAAYITRYGTEACDAIREMRDHIFAPNGSPS